MEEKIYVAREFAVSHDGEKIAATVEIEPKKVTPCVNGTPWDSWYEKIWSLKFSPDRRQVCAVLQDYKWNKVETYYPHWMEIVITVGIITIEVLAFRWIVNRMPILYDHQEYGKMY